MKKGPRTGSAEEVDPFSVLLPAAEREPDSPGRLARGRVPKAKTVRSDRSVSDGFESKKESNTMPGFEIRAVVPADEEPFMSPVRSYGPPSSRVLLAGEGPAEPELPNIMADPPMYYSEELEDDTSKKRWAKSSMSKRLSASLKRSLQNLPLFPKKKVADEEPPRRQGKLHAGPMSPKSLKPPEELKHGHGMHLVMERGESKSHSPSTYSRAIRPPSKEAPTVPPRTSPSKESSPTRFIPSKDASAMQLSIAPPSPTRTVRERKPTTPMSPSKPSAANKEEAPARRLSQLCVRGWTSGKKDDVADFIRKEEDFEQAERYAQYQNEFNMAMELHARGQAIELKPMTTTEEKEQMELERQLQESGLEGRDALAFMLSAKLGSLDDAFQYMDNASRGDSFAFVSWHTGLLVLRIDPEKIAGMSVKQSFQSISCGKAEITKVAWEDYFENWDDSAFNGRRRRRVALKPKLPQVRVEKPPEPPPPPEKPPTPEPERKPRVEVNKFKKATAKLALLSRLKPEEEEEDEEAIRAQANEELSNLHPDQSVKLLNLSRKKRAIHLQVARELNLWSSTQGSSLLVMREGPISQKLRQDVAELPLCTGIRLRALKAGPGLVLLGRTVAETENLRISKATGTCPNSCQELVLPKFSLAARSLDADEEDGYDVDIFNDQGSDPEIEEILKAQLADLPLQAMFEYPSAVGKDFRQCTVRVCQEFGFEVLGVSGFQERVVVGNLKESVEMLHSELAVDETGGELPGPSKSAFVQFGNDISRLEKEVIRREARKKGYLVVEDETGLKVSRMSEAPEATKEEGPIKELCKLSAEVFSQYATGRAGVQIYFRRGDLIMMLRDAPSDRAESLAKPLYQAFDDTLHLQIELTKASNGLSKQFFKVFLDKAMQQAGWYPSTEVLEALHKREENGGEEEYEDEEENGEPDEEGEEDVASQD